MNFQHQELANNWNKLTIFEQMANIGSEIIRAINWKNKNNLEYSRMAFERALELIYFTVADHKNIKRLREITKMRELLIDYLAGENIYKSSDECWQKYFYSFNYAARI